MAEIKYIRPRVASTEIDIALDLFERDEAVKRITTYVTGLLDDAESQFNRGMAEVKNENSGLNIPVVSQQRELFYNFITWYNAKPFIKKPESGLITTTIIEEYLKL